MTWGWSGTAGASGELAMACLQRVVKPLFGVQCLFQQPWLQSLLRRCVAWTTTSNPTISFLFSSFRIMSHLACFLAKQSVSFSS